MVQALIKGRVEKEQPPTAPWEDEARIQNSIEGILGRMLDSPRIEALDPILLGYLRDGRLRILSPIKIEFNTEGKNVIAEAAEINEFGSGENPSEALADLQRAIAELYFTLEKEQDRLGKDLQSVWNILKEKILKTIPASEVWLFNNPDAITSVRRGLNDAAQGRVSKVDLDNL